MLNYQEKNIVKNILVNFVVECKWHSNACISLEYS